MMAIDTTELEKMRPKNEIHIARHLASIDPVLESFAPKIVNSPIKDLSEAIPFGRGTERLEMTDLVAIHLTDTFPENGILHPTVYYDPKILRYTIHFTLNSTAQPVDSVGAKANWQNKKYAIIIPFDKIKTRIEEFNPGDTYVLDDLELPEGSVVIKDMRDEISTSVGKARLVEADYSKPGQMLSGLERATYEQMISMGYFPQTKSDSILGWPGDWNDNREILKEFCRRNGFKLGIGHRSHWSSKLDRLCIALEQAANEKDEEAFRGLADEAQRDFLSKLGEVEWRWNDQEVPQRYKHDLIELLRNYQKEVFPNVPIPDSAISQSINVDKN